MVDHSMLTPKSPLDRTGVRIALLLICMATLGVTLGRLFGP